MGTNIGKEPNTSTIELLTPSQVEDKDLAFELNIYLQQSLDIQMDMLEELKQINVHLAEITDSDEE